MITISDIEIVKDELIDIFPDAIRGSEANSQWGNGKRQLHLAFFIGADSVSGYMVEAHRGMYQIKEWDTNCGVVWSYAHQDRCDFADWVIDRFSGSKMHIARTVCESNK